MAVRVSKPFRARVRRQTVWVASADITGRTTLASDTIILDQSFLVSGASNAALVGSTVIRTRGYWSIKSDQFATSEDFMVAMGFGVVSSAARALGVTAVPSPIIEEQWDGWFVYEILDGAFTFGDATGFTSPSVMSAKFDSKAQRKLEDENAVVIVLENPFTVGLSYAVKFRMLFKLP